MVKFVYVDETGSPTGSLRKHPTLQLVAAIVDEQHVRGLGESMRAVGLNHLGCFPAQFEFHGVEVWNGHGYWEEKANRRAYDELLAAYEDVIALLDKHDVDIAYATIDRQALHTKYDGLYDDSAYRLALQFLLEKVHANISGLKIVIADESKEQQLKAMRMVADLQEWGTGEVSGRPIGSVIDSLHFVQSHASPGVQLADMVAYLYHRCRLTDSERHPASFAARSRMLETVGNHVRTYRWPWP